ncbi:hypothetical protein [Nocardia sp. NRRL WC-3656]|uniref:hypothetical protein n=1 Tax=Nocardia sp. NRRL WC-3656 TaxID=1463824 RepID=UPI0012DDDBB1|nr:hypothetical protein [Nocardia sp. NRRL WC-3656]
MPVAPRTRIRLKSRAGMATEDRIGYVAPTGHAAVVRTDFDHATGELVQVWSKTPPTRGTEWVVVWWPGNHWTWERESDLEFVDTDRKPM